MPKYTVKVKPNSRQEGVEVLEDGTILVKVNAPPAEGRANERVIELLAHHLGLPKSSLELIGGHKSKRKVFSTKA